MLENSMARKLFKYFILSFLLFSLIIGSVFMILFRHHAMKMHREDMLKRAHLIEESIAPYMQEKAVKMGFGAFMRFIGDIAGTDVWIVDENKNIVTAGSGHGKNALHTYVYKELPDNAGSIISEVLEDKEVYSGEFSSLFSDATLTLGIPIKGQQEQVLGAVLLHSPVNVTHDTVYSGLWMLTLSIAFALILSFFLALWLSKKFTDPIVLKEAEDIIKMDKIRKDFIANVSHELRTPITVIKGSAEALRDGVIKEKEKAAAYYSQIFSEAEYLQGMVGDLLELSKLQNPDFPMEKALINLKDVISDALRSANAIGAEKKVQVILGCSEDIIPIVGDYGKLRQMMLIILDNALKFSPPGSHIDVKLSSEQVIITDYGPGISEEELPHIFERFYKTREESNPKGSGLGLAIAFYIAQRHGFTIHAESDKGKRTSFIIKIKNTK